MRSPAAWVIPLAAVARESEAGGKARNLARLIEAGQRVPDGFVVTNAASESFLAEAGLTDAIELATERLDVRSPMGIQCAGETIAALVCAAEIPPALVASLDESFSRLGSGTLIVRSSAVGEDSVAASFAGQLDSIADVTSPGQLRMALLQVWASRWSPRALTYQLARKIPIIGMGVVIQKQLDSAVSGVVFTRAPDDSSRMLVEYCAGRGEALVAGKVNPCRLTVRREGLTSTRLDQSGSRSSPELLSASAIQQLAHAARAIETAFGTPQDIEWTFDTSGQLWIVQARPITAATAARIVDGATLVHWSNANIAENFPVPVSPFLYSVARDGYYHYFRNLGRAFGISPRRLTAMDAPLRHIIGVHGCRMYYNLTSIHGVLRSAPFGELLTSSFNQFVGATGTSSRAAVERSGRWRTLGQALEVCTIAVKTSWQYLFFPSRVSRFEKSVDVFAERTRPEKLAAKSSQELLNDLRGFVEIRNHRWKDAALADAASMVCYGLLQRLLARSVPESDHSSLPNNLLKGLPGLVSGTPALKLWELSEASRENAALAGIFNSQSPQSILQSIRTREEFAGFSRQLEDYLDDWGFRCSGELMLTTASFQEEPERVIGLLQGYRESTTESPAHILERQAQARIAETRRLRQSLKGKRLASWLPFVAVWPIISLVLRWTQKAILLRERARLKQALLYSRLRRIVLAIGDGLVEAGRLQHRDDGFFLTVQELDSLLAGVAMFPNHVRELVALRRRAHEESSAETLPDSFALASGEYLQAGTAPSSEETSPDREATQLRGAGACGGMVEASASVLNDVSEAQRLTAGDVLVTRQTDPGWGPIFPLVSGLVIERGGMLSHGAIIAREFGIPSVVGVASATSRIAHGARIRVDGDRGTVRILEES